MSVYQSSSLSVATSFDNLISAHYVWNLNSLFILYFRNFANLSTILYLRHLLLDDLFDIILYLENVDKLVNIRFSACCT